MVIGPRYFESLATKPVSRPNLFDADPSGIAIVNERLAAIHFRGRDPIGQQIRILATSREPASEWLTIVGVAPNVLQHTIEGRRDFDPVVYVPYASHPLPFTMLLVRSDVSQSVTVSLLRDAIRALDPTFRSSTSSRSTRSWQTIAARSECSAPCSRYPPRLPSSWRPSDSTR